MHGYHICKSVWCSEPVECHAWSSIYKSVWSPEPGESHVWSCPETLTLEKEESWSWPGLKKVKAIIGTYITKRIFYLPNNQDVQYIE